MNGEGTLALWLQGKSAWEMWGRGLSDRKDALTAAGKWSVDWYGEGQNDETKAWLQDAVADFTDASFGADADSGASPVSAKRGLVPTPASRKLSSCGSAILLHAPASTMHSLRAMPHLLTHSSLVLLSS
jgi:hypothetical protein